MSGSLADGFSAVPSFVFLLHLSLVGFGLNLIWEFSHAWLYETCRRQSWQKNVRLLTIMAAKDGLFIVLFYLVSFVLFPGGLGLFILLCLVFSFADEKLAIRWQRWEYAAAMPTVFGVGVTPFLEIAVTGVVAFAIVGLR